MTFLKRPVCHLSIGFAFTLNFILTAATRASALRWAEVRAVSRRTPFCASPSWAELFGVRLFFPVCAFVSSWNSPALTQEIPANPELFLAFGLSFDYLFYLQDYSAYRTISAHLHSELGVRPAPWGLRALRATTLQQGLLHR